MVELMEILALCIRHFGDSFCSINACFSGNDNNLKLVSSSSIKREVSYSCST